MDNKDDRRSNKQLHTKNDENNESERNTVNVYYLSPQERTEFSMVAVVAVVVVVVF